MTSSYLAEKSCPGIDIMHDDLLSSRQSHSTQKKMYTYIWECDVFLANVLPHVWQAPFNSMLRCVCVCVSFPSILVTVPPMKVRGVLRFAAYSGDYTSQRISSVPLNQPGVTQEGANTGAFSFLFFFNAPPLPAVIASIFYREKGSAFPSLVDNEVEFGRLTKLFSF